MKPWMTIDTVHWGMIFPMAYLAAFLTAATIMILHGRKKGYPMGPWLLILVTGAVCFIIGDKASTYSADQWTTLLTTLRFPPATEKNALGGIIGMVTGIFLAKNILGFKRPVIDSLAIALPLALAISRIGCLMAGCCFGAPTDLPWGIHYDASSLAGHAHLAEGLIAAQANCSHAVHPVQLYQVAGCLLIALLAWLTAKKWKAPGSLFLFSMACYGFLRFGIEFLVDPASNTFAAPGVWGMTLVQWIVAGTFFPGLSLLLYRESAWRPLITSCPARFTDLRRVVLALLLMVLVIRNHGWFDILEMTAILLFLLPALLLGIASLHHKHSVSGFRWVIPSLLVCTISFMSQKSNEPTDNKNKITYHEVSLYGLAGKYYEELQRVDGFDCGGPLYSSVATQSTPFYEAGFNYSYNILKDKYSRTTVGGRLFLGDDKPEQTTISSGEGPVFGISPYFTMNRHWFGITAGFTLGQTKIAIEKPENKQHVGEIISAGYAWTAITPAFGIRLGPEDILYMEGMFPGFFPSSTPYPLYKVGIGSGFGKTNGVKAAFGYCNGIYLEARFPVKNTFIFEAMYASNAVSGIKANRMFSFGFTYRMPEQKESLPPDNLALPLAPMPAMKEGGIVTDLDGNSYPVLVVDSMAWMTQDLRVTRYRNGARIADSVMNDTANTTWYAWSAVTDSSHLCPSGWHVPSREEWTALSRFHSGSGEAGNEIKERFTGGNLVLQWWSSTPLEGDKALSFSMNSETKVMMITGVEKSTLLPVRCTRDKHMNGK